MLGVMEGVGGSRMGWMHGKVDWLYNRLAGLPSRLSGLPAVSVTTCSRLHVTCGGFFRPSGHACTVLTGSTAAMLARLLM